MGQYLQKKITQRDQEKKRSGGFKKNFLISLPPDLL
jgi:hypothetical protein